MTTYTISKISNATLAVLIGYPKETIYALEKAIKRDGETKIKHVLSVPYSRRTVKFSNGYLEEVLRNAFEFIIKNFSKEDKSLDIPSTFKLIFPKIGDHVNILNFFHPIASYIPIDTKNDHGLLYNKEKISKITLSAIKSAPPAISYKLSDQRLLPLRNFDYDSNHDFLWKEFAASIGEYGLPTCIANIQQCKIIKDELKYKNVPSRAYVDDRRYAFFKTQSGTDHGLARIDKNAQLTSDIKCFFQAAYRFGTAIPIGLHYDVTALNGEQLNGSFFCCKKEAEHSVAKVDYVNVYPNDTIRPG